MKTELERYKALRKKLGWRELHGFVSSATPDQTEPNDCWMQRDGIAVWCNPGYGLNIGIKHWTGSGYQCLENCSKIGINHPPRSKMSLEQIIPLWIEGVQNISDFRLKVRLTM